jgi:hypothetical protein
LRANVAPIQRSSFAKMHHALFIANSKMQPAQELLDHSPANASWTRMQINLSPLAFAILTAALAGCTQDAGGGGEPLATETSAYSTKLLRCSSSSGNAFLNVSQSDFNHQISATLDIGFGTVRSLYPVAWNIWGANNTGSMQGSNAHGTLVARFEGIGAGAGVVRLVHVAATRDGATFDLDFRNCALGSRE